MTRIDDYLLPNRTQNPTAATRAASTWAWILLNASEITIQRGTSTTVAAQTVRIEANAASEIGSPERGKAATRSILVFGVTGHNSVDDTDLLRDDRFSYNATPTGRLNYRIISIDKTQIGQIQATAEEIT